MTKDTNDDSFIDPLERLHRAGQANDFAKYGNGPRSRKRSTAKTKPPAAPSARLRPKTGFNAPPPPVPGPDFTAAQIASAFEEVTGYTLPKSASFELGMLSHLRSKYGVEPIPGTTDPVRWPEAVWPIAWEEVRQAWERRTGAPQPLEFRRPSARSQVTPPPAVRKPTPKRVGPAIGFTSEQAAAAFEAATRYRFHTTVPGTVARRVGIEPIPGTSTPRLWPLEEWSVVWREMTALAERRHGFGERMTYTRAPCPAAPAPVVQA